MPTSSADSRQHVDARRFLLRPGLRHPALAVQDPRGRADLRRGRPRRPPSSRRRAASSTRSSAIAALRLANAEKLAAELEAAQQAARPRPREARPNGDQPGPHARGARPERQEPGPGREGTAAGQGGARPCQRRYSTRTPRTWPSPAPRPTNSKRCSPASNSKLTATDAELIKKRGELEDLTQQLELAKKQKIRAGPARPQQGEGPDGLREQAQGVREEARRGDAFGRRHEQDAGAHRSARKGRQGRADQARRGQRHDHRPARHEGQARGQGQQAADREREQVRRHRHDRQERRLPGRHVREHGPDRGERRSPPTSGRASATHCAR